LEKLGNISNYKYFIFLPFFLIASSKIYAQPKTSNVLELTGKKQWDRFGSSLALQNDVALMRSRENIYFYKHESNAWKLKQIFQGHDSSEDAFSFFGESIDIDNEFVVCGDRKASLGSTMYPGAAYVFKYDGERWTEFAKLSPNDPQEDKNFGVDVSIDDDLIVVGAHHYDKGGAAYVFRYVDCEWVQEAKLSPSDNLGFISFGWRVDIDSSRIVVGTFEGNSAYIYEYENGTWIETANIKKDARRFGSEVVIKGDNVFVSARNESPDPNEISTLSVLSGAVYQYKKKSNNWSEVKKIFPSRSGADLFGSSLAISDNELAIVSRLAWETGDPNDGEDQGLISFYRWDSDVSKPIYELNYSIGATGDRWGGVVEMDGHNIIYSEVDVDSSVIESTGLVYIYNDQVHQSLLIDDIETDDPYCAEEGSLSINASGGVAPLTYSIDGGVTFYPDANFSNLPSGGYMVYVKDVEGKIYRQCVTLEDIAGLDIEIVELVPPTCAQKIGEVSFIGSGGRAPYQYSIDGEIYQEEDLFKELGQGDFTGFISDDDGCIDTIAFRLDAESDFEIINAVSSNARCGESNGSIDLDFRGAIGEVSYTVDDDLKGEGAFIDQLTKGSYHIILKDEADCISEIDVELQDDDCPIYVPNIFTPNGDGVNDEFSIYTPVNFDGESITLRIYDRWGGVIYEKINFDLGMVSLYRAL